jgi:Arc/MetJ-type ribon-helix-helix transcriptional regulator
MSQIAVRLTDAELAQLDSLVDDEGFSTRAEAVRAGIRLLNDVARERRIRVSYENAYCQAPLTHDEAALLDTVANLAAELPG